ncbi:MAG: 5'/3'-nucleotidase SurE [Thermostichales cyanobacterium DRC_bins_46]
MNILLSNDDGILAPGIRCLAAALAQHHQVTVVAPDRERSATGHALTLHKPLRVEAVGDPYPAGVAAWACSGTPADCVKFGLDALLKTTPPDWVIAGINRGANLGTDVLYSGTVSAAMEGLLEGIPSLAISLASYSAKEVQDFQGAADFALSLLTKLGIPSVPTLLNVNVPAGAKIRGCVVVPLGVRKYVDIYEQRSDPRGKDYYWLAGEVITDGVDPDTDLHAIQQDWITITPLQFNLTDWEQLGMYSRWFTPYRQATG